MEGVIRSRGNAQNKAGKWRVLLGFFDGLGFIGFKVFLGFFEGLGLRVFLGFFEGLGFRV